MKGKRTYAMVAIAAVLQFVLEGNYVSDPFLLDTLANMRTAAFAAIPVFMRMGIKSTIK